MLREENGGLREIHCLQRLHSFKLLFIGFYCRYIPSYSGYATNTAIFCFTILFNLPRFFELRTEALSVPECEVERLWVRPTR